MDAASGSRPRKPYISARLEQLASQWADYPMTVFSAPMGCGKSVAMQYLAQSAEQTVVRIAARSADTFWAQMCDLLVPGIPADAPLSILCAAAMRRGSQLLIIEDYQKVQSPELTEQLLALALGAPGQLHILLATRRLLYKPDSTPVCKGDVLLLNADDLALPQTEILPFCRSCGMKLSGQEAATLYTYTEGWMMGMYALLADYARTGSIRIVPALLDNLLASVETLPAPLPSFLFEIAVASDFTVEQATALSRRSDAALLLEQLQIKGFFIHCREGVWRLYPLVAGALRRKLEASDDAQTAYLRLGDWELRCGRLKSAVCAYAKAQAPDRLLRVLVLPEVKSVNSFPSRQELDDWYRICSVADFKENPHAILYFAFHFFFYGEWKRYEDCLSLLYRIMPAQPTSQREQLRCWLERMLAITACDARDMSTHLRAAFSSGAIATVPFHNALLFGLPTLMALLTRSQNPLDTATTLQELETDLQVPTRGVLSGLGSVAYAEAMYNSANFDEARIAARRAHRLAERNGQNCLLFPVYLLEAKLAYAMGRLDRVQEILSHARRNVADMSDMANVFTCTVDMMDCHFLARSDRPQQVAAWLRNGDFDSVPLSAPARPYALYCHGRYLYYRGQYTQLLSLEDEMLRDEGTPATAAPFVRLRCLLMLAAANNKLKRNTQAMQLMDEAVEIARAYNFVLPFGEQYDTIAPLLEAGQWDWKPLQKRIPELGAYFAGKGGEDAEIHTRSASGLTMRETEIATLASRGMYNREISKQLNISENTIKSALQSVYGKLGIRSRRELSAALRGPRS